MHRKILMLAVAAMACTALVANADDHAMHKDKAVSEDMSKSASITGEIVDTACYLGHAAKGEKHAACAAKCINGGAPMGLLTADGTVWLLTPNHDNPDAYNALKAMAAKMVTVTGEKMERGGMKGLDVTAYKAVAANAESKGSTESKKDGS